MFSQHVHFPFILLRFCEVGDQPCDCLQHKVALLPIGSLSKMITRPHVWIMSHVVTVHGVLWQIHRDVSPLVDSLVFPHACLFTSSGMFHTQMFHVLLPHDTVANEKHVSVDARSVFGYHRRYYYRSTHHT